MFEVAVIEDPGAAEVSLDPTRAPLLAEPASATAPAAKVGLPRRKVNHHLKALERHGLITGAAEARRRIATSPSTPPGTPTAVKADQDTTED
jgi:DNA-binding transcriptional ArsR family regulator